MLVIFLGLVNGVDVIFVLGGECSSFIFYDLIISICILYMYYFILIFLWFFECIYIGFYNYFIDFKIY